MKQSNFHTAITVHSIRWQNGRRFSTGSWRLSALSSMVVLLLMKVVTSLYAMVLMEKVSITSTGVGQATATVISTSPSSTLQSAEQVPENLLTDITATALSSSVLRRTTESRMSRW